jgi:hypothetical protein
MKLELEYQGTFGETFIYAINMMCFHVSVMQKSPLFKCVFHDLRVL